MLKELQDKANKTYTENGALTYKSTESACLDLFASIGALRNARSEQIINRFIRAYAENKLMAMKILFFARDIRKGLGERRIFRVIYKYLLCTGLPSGVKNLHLIPEYGRFDDLISLLPVAKADVTRLIRKKWDEDIVCLSEGKPVSLLAKWLPSVNASSNETRKLAHMVARALNLTPAEYRKALSMLRKHIGIIENYLRERNYTFDYSKQPSKAMLKYRDCFYSNDEERYTAFLDSVRKGKAKINTGTLYPYEIIEPIIKVAYGQFAFCPSSQIEPLSNEIVQSLTTTWQALPDYTRGENALVVVDGSGSMYNGHPMAISVALSLGLYYAERNKGHFAGHFITFSKTPQLVRVTGDTLQERVMHAISYNECVNTNISAVFKLILDAAVENNVPQEEMPQRIYIISDMEFDACAEGADITNFEYAKKMFAEAGYHLPQVVFWNVQSRKVGQPVRMNDRGVVLISGASPVVFSMAMDDIDPYEAMLKIINTQRYESIRE